MYPHYKVTTTLSNEIGSEYRDRPIITQMDSVYRLPSVRPKADIYPLIHENQKDIDFRQHEIQVINQLEYLPSANQRFLEATEFDVYRSQHMSLGLELATTLQTEFIQNSAPGLIGRNKYEKIRLKSLNN